ncbi:acyl-CoA dehydrogenase family protein [Pseudonocardia eucalypti]|uniref:Acyl-CoA dehydrogenase family protein n=1 Tax=Pseudonocardia eucalypti TaxID=648755 RepID=A0ABP9PYD3_9PSEU|nr:alkylation response protein AidB-like acyl-CoA dehydrogenase [Pseudonocardia eucalypti]
MTVEELAAEAERYLAAHYPKAAGDERSKRFVWGEGDDEVRVFQEPDPETEADAMPAIRAWRRGLWEAGLGWITGPPEYGGRGLSGAHQWAFERVVRRYQVPGDSSLTISLGMIAPTILRHGSEEQKRHYLPKLYSGELISCQLFSEPGAGSDLASLSTRAVRGEDGDWRVSGQKVWTSGAHLSDIGEIICRTADGPRHRNLTAFLVDMRAPGVTVRPLRQMTGGAAFNEVFLDDVVVPDSARLGAEGEGWPVALTTLSNERNAMGHSSFGGAGILSTERLAELVRHTPGAAEDPVVRRAFGELQVQLRVARYAQQVAGARARAGDSPGPEAALHKIALSDNIARLGRFVAEVLGPKAAADTGEWGTYAWTSVILGAPGYRLGGGTDEVLKNVIAQRVLGLPRPN